IPFSSPSSRGGTATGPGVEAALVDRYEQDRGATVEDLLRPAAVVSTPVNDKDASHALLLDVPCHNGDVVQVAEPPSAPGTGMVAGRPDHGKGIRHVTCEDLIGCSHGPSCRKERPLKEAGGYVRIR